MCTSIRPHKYPLWGLFHVQITLGWHLWFYEAEGDVSHNDVTNV